MAKEHVTTDDDKDRAHRASRQSQAERGRTGMPAHVSQLAGLQRRVGNRAVWRALAQRGGGEAFELDDETASRIDRERGGGQPLDSRVQAELSAAMGHDFSGVRVHTSPGAGALSRQLDARAFTAGRDVFFRDGSYDPHSSGGQELIAHELTHVVQQSAGASGRGGKMTVNAPGDVYEQQADAISKTVAGPGFGAEVQRQIEEEEEEELVQRAQEDEEEELV